MRLLLDTFIDLLVTNMAIPMMATLTDLPVSGEQLHSIVIAALAVVVLGFVFNTLRSPLAKVPGPWYSTFTSLVLTKHWLKGTRARYVHKLHLKYGMCHETWLGKADGFVAWSILIILCRPSRSHRA